MTNGLLKVAASAVGAVTKTKPVQKVCDAFINDPAKALAYTTIGSIVAKDGVGCAMYVYQSLNNKDIPAKRRTFVSALDLSNGILMILAQIGMFFSMRKISKGIFNKLFSNVFDTKTIRSVAEILRMNRRNAGIVPERKPEIFEACKKHQDKLAGIFGDILDLAAATIIGKRIIVPFIATPIASKLENWMNKKFNINEEAIDTKNTDKNDKQEKPGNTINIVSTQGESTNLLSKYKS